MKRRQSGWQARIFSRMRPTSSSGAWVDPAARGAGWGRRLMEHVIEWAENPHGSRLACSARTLSCMTERLIERVEVVALLFNVSDIAVTLTNIERLLGEDDGEEEADEG
jgi:GNAT superfamily N-acetyltransferase